MCESMVHEDTENIDITSGGCVMSSVFAVSIVCVGNAGIQTARTALALSTFCRRHSSRIASVATKIFFTHASSATR